MDNPKAPKKTRAPKAKAGTLPSVIEELDELLVKISGLSGATEEMKAAGKVFAAMMHSMTK